MRRFPGAVGFSRIAIPLLFALIFGAVWCAITSDEVRPVRGEGGWGIDACLSCFVPRAELDDYFALLAGSNIQWVRERGTRWDSKVLGVSEREVWRLEKQRGLKVIAFAGASGLSVEQESNQLPEELLAVYRSFFKAAWHTRHEVDAWEMVGEPDTGFCKDLPDRVAAFQKAVYLGLKDGSKNSTNEIGVLMGALGLPPGPWLDRAARNGLYDYTDGVNFHFYGRADDLREVIVAQRDVARAYVQDRDMPLWITECGIDAVPKSRMNDPHGRDLQKKFTLETSEIAKECGVSVFMPFILIHSGDGYAMVESAKERYPAWTAYADYTLLRALPAAPAFTPVRNPGRVVLQWIPDNETCLPDKVSGTYWFVSEDNILKPIRGEVRMYNFSNRTIRGVLEMAASGPVQITGVEPDVSREMEIPPLGCLRLKVSFKTGGQSFFRGEVEVRFLAQGVDKPSVLVFGLGTRPDDSLLPVKFEIQGRQPRGSFSWIWAPEPYQITFREGPWLGVNGLEILNSVTVATTTGLGKGFRFHQIEAQDDPKLPPMAITMVDGLPDVPNGFLRLRMPEDEMFLRPIRVDLVDSEGQRFTMAENSGRNWIDPIAGEILLAYRDFHPFGWGRYTEHPSFQPSQIREIQLRFYNKVPAKSAFVQIDVVAPDPNVKP